MDEWDRLQREFIELRAALERERDPEAREALTRRLEDNRLAVDDIERGQGNGGAVATALDSVPVDDAGRVILDELDLELARLGRDLDLSGFDFVLPPEGCDEVGSDAVAAGSNGNGHHPEGGDVDQLPGVAALGSDIVDAVDQVDDLDAAGEMDAGDGIGVANDVVEGSDGEPETGSGTAMAVGGVDVVVTSDASPGEATPAGRPRGAHDLGGGDVDDLLEELIGPTGRRSAGSSATPFLVAGALVAVVVLGLVWALARDDGGAADPADELEEVRGVLAALGLADVEVTAEGSTVVIQGEVTDPVTRTHAVAAAAALLDGHDLDATGFTVVAPAAGPSTGESPEPAATDGATRDDRATSAGEAGDVGGGDTVGGQGAAGALPPISGDDGIAAGRLQHELDRLLAGTPVVFDTGQIQLTELQRRVLNSVVALLQVYPEQRLRVVGRTDVNGSDDENVALSTARAEAVAAYLIETGVAAERLEIDGRGESTSSGSAAPAGLERQVAFEVVG
ncbi:MAG: OmpA family protein [Acidimicrobiales bacterium]